MWQPPQQPPDPPIKPIPLPAPRVRFSSTWIQASPLTRPDPPPPSRPGPPMSRRVPSPQPRLGPPRLQPKHLQCHRPAVRTGLPAQLPPTRSVPACAVLLSEQKEEHSPWSCHRTSRDGGPVLGWDSHRLQPQSLQRHPPAGRAVLSGRAGRSHGHFGLAVGLVTALADRRWAAQWW